MPFERERGGRGKGEKQEKINSIKNREKNNFFGHISGVTRAGPRRMKPTQDFSWVAVNLVFLKVKILASVSVGFPRR